MNEALSILKAIREEASRNLLAYVADLSDEEYLWEPVPGCWSVRPDGDGGFRAEWELTPLEEPIGAIAGQYAESSYIGLIGHLTNEYVHHAAEIRLLRHLYRSGGATSLA